MLSETTEHIDTYLQQVKETISLLSIHKISQVVTTLLEASQTGRKVFIFGNGGSASTASHFACDLAKNTIVSGAPRFKVIALNDNIPLMTAWANDSSYDNIFAEQLVALVDPDDVVIGISCSGNSSNVLKAMTLAKTYGAKTIAFTGDKGGRLKDIADIYITVASPRIEQQEDIHLLLEHCICATIRQRLLDDAAVDLATVTLTNMSISAGC
ncbi:MAG TPA: SIS domain-containing protein [Anaerolineae bacterium]|nr:SIS domain-containing protein [Anaerolineae bacterium]